MLKIMAKQKYILTPRNEGQEMNCRVKITTTGAEAITVATKMAGEIQAALLMQGEVCVGIQTNSEALRGECNTFARWDGKVVDGDCNPII